MNVVAGRQTFRKNGGKTTFLLLVSSFKVVEESIILFEFVWFTCTTTIIHKSIYFSSVFESS